MPISTKYRRLLLGFIFIALTIAITFPMVLDLNAWLVFSDSKGRVRVQDQLNSVIILNKMKKTLLTGNSPVEVMFLSPRFYVSPSYALLGGALSILLSPLVAHNLLILIYVFLAILCMYLLAHKITHNAWAALYAAAIFAMSNFMIHHIVDGHTHVVQMFWLPAIFLALENTISSPSYKNGCILGIIASMLLMSCAHYLLYLSFLLPLYTVLRKPNWATEKLSKFCLVLAVALGVMLVTSGYYLLLATQRETLTYSLSTNLYYSLTNAKQLVDANAEAHVGIIPLILVFFSSVWIIAKDRKSIAPVVLFLVCIVLMFGPFASTSPYTLLYKYWPYVSKMRTPLKLCPLALLASALLSAYAIAFICSRKMPWKIHFVIVGIVYLATLYLHPYSSGYYERGKIPGIGMRKTLETHPPSPPNKEFSFAEQQN